MKAGGRASWKSLASWRPWAVSAHGLDNWMCGLGHQLLHFRVVVQRFADARTTTAVWDHRQVQNVSWCAGPLGSRNSRTSTAYRGSKIVSSSTTTTNSADSTASTTATATTTNTSKRNVRRFDLMREALYCQRCCVYQLFVAPMVRILLLIRLAAATAAWRDPSLHGRHSHRLFLQLSFVAGAVASSTRLVTTSDRWVILKVDLTHQDSIFYTLIVFPGDLCQSCYVSTVVCILCLGYGRRCHYV